MRYMDRVMIGLILVIVSIVCLFLGSPHRTGGFDPSMGLVYGFAIFFALGFIFLSMGILGLKDDYPALLSGFVLYFMVGGLIAIFLYVNTNATWRLADADDARFWLYWTRIMAMWPFELVQMTGILGYHT